MKISVIVAKSENDVIGRNNDLPWRLKEDLQNFKKITIGHHILMGRKTFESIGKALPGRVSLVVSSSPHANSENLYWFNSLFRAIKYAERNGETELFIIGGEKIFRSTLSLTNRLYLTEVKSKVEGNVFFPTLSPKNWKLVGEQHFSKNENNDFDFVVKTLDRK